MKKVKRGLLYFFMLEKRFFKKPAFLLLLFTIPLLAFCLKNVSGEESGILSIGLYQEETEDDAVQEVIEALLQKESVIHFERVESEESGRERVQKRELDALWIFREDFQDKIEGILTGEEGEAPILSVEQEDTVVLQLSRVKLFGEAYGNVAYPIYRNFVHQYWGESVSEEELQRIFAEGSGMQKMFYTVYEKVGTDRPEQHYMTAPLRQICFSCGMWRMVSWMQCRAGKGRCGAGGMNLQQCFRLRQQYCWHFFCWEIQRSCGRRYSGWRFFWQMRQFSVEFADEYVVQR